MEYEYENVHIFDLPMAAEYQYKAGARRVLFWGVFSAAFGVFYLIRGLTGETLNLLISLVFLGMGVYYFTMPYRYLKKNQAQLLEHYKGNLPQVRTRFGEQITFGDGETEATLDYSDINKVLSMKRGYYLRYSKDYVVVLDPNGFTKGDFAGFKAFLREKRPDLKIPE